MFHTVLASVAGALLLTLLLAAAPPPPRGAFATGAYRNLFVEAGHSAQESRAKIDAAFRQLFHGDPSTQGLYYPAGSNANGPLAYILDVMHNDVRSEGISYGMMIAVQLDKKPEFDALWNWARTYMYHSQGPAQGFFSWSVKTDGKPNDEMPAPDGEEYIATSLYFAAARWGSNYKAEADRLLTDMLHRAVATGPTLAGPRTSGPLFDAAHKMVRFSPVLGDARNTDDGGHTDPSYHLPAFYELWARWGPAADRAFWAQAAAASREFFEKAAHPSTGLAPEYANYDGTPWAAHWNKMSVHFSYDSWRTAMNWSVDWAWWAADPREPQRSDRLQAFFEAHQGNQFTLDGHPLDKSHSDGLTAMNAVVSLAATEPRARTFVEALWNMPIPKGGMRYYDGALYLFALLHCGGEFRIWGPTGHNRGAQ
jgi:oligosaccharide reducing-end xylanase